MKSKNEPTAMELLIGINLAMWTNWARTSVAQAIGTRPRDLEIMPTNKEMIQSVNFICALQKEDPARYDYLEDAISMLSANSEIGGRQLQGDMAKWSQALFQIFFIGYITGVHD